MSVSRRSVLAATAAAAGGVLAGLGGCDEGSGGGTSSTTGPSGASTGSGKTVSTIGVAFETLQTEAWFYSFKAIRQELAKRNIRMLEAVAENDASRQLEQVNNFLAKKVDGIILVPKDADTAMRMVEAGNDDDVPIVLFNRPPRDPNARCTTVVATTRS